MKDQAGFRGGALQGVQRACCFDCHWNLPPLYLDFHSGELCIIAVCGHRHFHFERLLRPLWRDRDTTRTEITECASSVRASRNMLRARVLAARETGHPETAEALLDNARSNGIVLAGWQLGAELVGELETADYDPSPRHRVVEQAELGGRPLWLRAENDFDAAQAETLAAIVMAEMADR